MVLLQDAISACGPVSDRYINGDNNLPGVMSRFIPLDTNILSKTSEGVPRQAPRVDGRDDNQERLHHLGVAMTGFASHQNDIWIFGRYKGRREEEVLA